MSTTQANININAFGKSLFNLKANLTNQGQSKTIDLSLDNSQLDILINALLQVKHDQQEAMNRQKAEYIGKQTDKFLDDLTNLSTVQQISYVARHVAFPVLKRWLNPEQKGNTKVNEPTKNNTISK